MSAAAAKRRPGLNADPFIRDEKIPPLRAGDHLTLKEFLRRWENEPNIKYAELIGGVVYIPSPLGIDHGDMHYDLATWLGDYSRSTPGTKGSISPSTIMGKGSPQPDLLLRILPENQGATGRDGKFLSGPPELILEVCASSAAYDLHEKLKLYQAQGVREYIAVLVFEEEVRWHQLKGKKYRLLHSDDEGIYRSQIFPGLWLAWRALFEADKTPLTTILQQGLASPEHQAFVEKLAQRKKELGS